MGVTNHLLTGMILQVAARTKIQWGKTGPSQIAHFKLKIRTSPMKRWVLFRLPPPKQNPATQDFCLITAHLRLQVVRFL